VEGLEYSTDRNRVVFPAILESLTSSMMEEGFRQNVPGQNKGVACL